jgi:hypothetical protein
MNKPAIVGFILIILLVASVITPAVSKQITIDKENRLESNPEQGDSRLLATLRMDFGEDIYNDRIEYESINWRPAGVWYVNVEINFKCPDNMKIEVRYTYYAELDDWPNNWITFCDVKDSVTIINGSNPPDININYTKRVEPYWGWYLLRLRISANLTAYEYVDGEWVKINNNDTYKVVHDWLRFYKSRTFERTHYIPFIQLYENLIERFPNMFPILRHLLRL